MIVDHWQNRDNKSLTYASRIYYENDDIYFVTNTLYFLKPKSKKEIQREEWQREKVNMFFVSYHCTAFSRRICTFRSKQRSIQNLASPLVGSVEHKDDQENLVKTKSGESNI